MGFGLSVYHLAAVGGPDVLVAPWFCCQFKYFDSTKATATLARSHSESFKPFVVRSSDGASSSTASASLACPLIDEYAAALRKQGSLAALPLWHQGVGRSAESTDGDVADISQRRTQRSSGASSSSAAAASSDALALMDDTVRLQRLKTVIAQVLTDFRWEVSEEADSGAYGSHAAQRAHIVVISPLTASMVKILDNSLHSVRCTSAVVHTPRCVR